MARTTRSIRVGVLAIAALTARSAAAAGAESCDLPPEIKSIPVTRDGPAADPAAKKVQDAIRKVPSCILGCNGADAEVLLLPEMPFDANAYYCHQRGNGAIYLPLGHVAPDAAVRGKEIEKIAGACPDPETAEKAWPLDRTVLHEACHHMDKQCLGGFLSKSRKADGFLRLKYKSAYACYQSSPNAMRAKEALDRTFKERERREKPLDDADATNLREFNEAANRVLERYNREHEAVDAGEKAGRIDPDAADRERERIADASRDALRRLEEERQRHNRQTVAAREAITRDFEAERCRQESALNAAYRACGLLSRFPGDRHAADDPFGLEYYAMAIEMFAYDPAGFCAQLDPTEIGWLRKNLGSCLENLAGPRPACWSDPRRPAAAVVGMTDALRATVTPMGDCP